MLTPLRIYDATQYMGTGMRLQHPNRRNSRRAGISLYKDDPRSTSVSFMVRG